MTIKTNAFKKKNGVLLISPPFNSLTTPYISLAVLAGYLKSVHIPVSVYDCTPAFYKEYCSLDKCIAGLEAMQKKFISLNKKSQLIPSEAAEVIHLFSLISEVNSRGIERIMPDTAIQIATYPYWPNGLVKRPFIKLMTDTSIFSSKELGEAASQEYFFTESLRKDLRDQVDRSKPLLVGLSVVFDGQMPIAMHCARLIKEYAPHIHITMGGAFGTLHLGKIKNQGIFDFVDSIVFDEGELPLQQLYEDIHEKKGCLEMIPGVMCRNRQQEIIKNPSFSPPDMEELAFCDYVSCGLDQYPVPVQKMTLSLRLSRGCYWKKCTFCRTEASFCQNYQQPSVERVFKELCFIIETTGVRNFFFSDESSNPLILESLSKKILEHKLDISWSFHTRIDKRLTRERVQLFKEAGCKGFNVGIESFCDRILVLIAKGITESLVLEVLSDIKGILPISGYMMVGIPGETKVEADYTYATAQELIKKGILQGVSFSMFQLVAESDMWNNPAKYSIKVDSLAIDGDMQPNITARLATTTGMTRQEAFRLFFKYSFSFPQTMKKGPQVLLIDEIPVICNYPVSYLLESIVDYMNYQNEMPYKQWLNFLDANLSPIQPYSENI